MSFPAGTFADTTVVTVTPVSTDSLAGYGNFRFLGLAYEIEATYLSTGLQAQPSAGQSYYVEIGYDENALGGVAESALCLYYWDGAKWVAEPTSQVDAAANRIMAWPTHFSSWAFGVLRSGSTPTPSPTRTPSPTPVTTVTPPLGSRRIYVPLVLRSWSAVVNDQFDGAILVDYVPWTALQSGNDRATKGNDDPIPCSGSGGKSVWYRIRVPADQAIEVSTAGSSYDTVVGVYTGWPPYFTQVICNDDWGGARTSQVAFTAYAYTDYYVVVTSYQADSGGDLQLEVHR